MHESLLLTQIIPIYLHYWYYYCSLQITPSVFQHCLQAISTIELICLSNLSPCYQVFSSYQLIPLQNLILFSSILVLMLVLVLLSFSLTLCNQLQGHYIIPEDSHSHFATLIISIITVFFQILVHSQFIQLLNIFSPIQSSILDIFAHIPYLAKLFFLQVTFLIQLTLPFIISLAFIVPSLMQSIQQLIQLLFFAVLFSSKLIQSPSQFADLKTIIRIYFDHSQHLLVLPIFPRTLSTSSLILVASSFISTHSPKKNKKQFIKQKSSFFLLLFQQSFFFLIP